MQLLNFFLSALTPKDHAALIQNMSEITLGSTQVIFDTGDSVDTIYFPGSACVSLVTVLRDGKAVETSTVGRESVVALIDAITNRPSRSRVFAQIGGSAMRVPAAAFRTQLSASAELLSLVLLHARACSLQAEQGVACNATHGVHGRLARWLLMTQDRVGTSAFPLTQEYMAVMTGVQRSTVSTMAATLKRAGVIDYSRGRLTILDRPALLRHACECYAVVGRQFEDLRTEAA
ncbi:Crp/Fnr family transcriptional regulator [Phenylobacterium sp. LjRoot219]|uniref:Crp/Fnr family transcriptional regulator n=1 Tax=Phenylobacterium sp. LjRoot219 TaxID=3342283 RepID=UPI003ECE88F1